MGAPPDHPTKSPPSALGVLAWAMLGSGTALIIWEFMGYEHPIVGGLLALFMSATFFVVDSITGGTQP